MSSQVQQVRKFNRTVTRHIGVLRDDFLGRKRPLGESRLLYEIGPGGRDVRELRAGLGLDSGYMSRLLRSLEKQGLVVTRASPSDARIRRAELTGKGQKEYGQLNALSDDAAGALLSGLGKTDRETMLAAMNTVVRLLERGTVTIRHEDANSPDARWCLEQYLAFIDERFEGGYDPGKAAPAEADAFMPPGGIFLVARKDGQPVGCGGLKRNASTIGEIKRVWVSEEARGAGLGQRLLEALEAHARELGYRRIRLDTNNSLTEAQALYLKNGYREVPPFNDDPYPDHWFEKKLR